VESAGGLFHQRTGKRLLVHTTLRDGEWAALPPGARKWMFNHGESTAQQVLDIYRQVDAIFFPSLLETSSVTPLEANVLGIPLLASDRDFVRSSADAALLFEPKDPGSVAAALIEFEADKDRFWRRARSTAVDYREQLSGSSRSEAYFDLVDGQLAADRAAA
jgi:glycosyltransferase involved in cell wall biosynthesis